MCDCGKVNMDLVKRVNELHEELVLLEQKNCILKKDLLFAKNMYDRKHGELLLSTDWSFLKDKLGKKPTKDDKNAWIDAELEGCVLGTMKLEHDLEVNKMQVRALNREFKLYSENLLFFNSVFNGTGCKCEEETCKMLDDMWEEKKNDESGIGSIDELIDSCKRGEKVEFH